MGSRRNCSIDSTATFSSPELLSPGGKSRYGRTRKPKVARDFCNIDDVEIVGDSSSLSPTKAPIKSPEIVRDVVFEVRSECTKLDDLEMKVANNYKINLQRGVDASMKERKFFKATPESTLNVPTPVDVNKVLKLISGKPSNLLSESKVQKNALKTYSNKKKHVQSNYIVESFGLPDEPIVPLTSPVKAERNASIDVDMDKEVDVNLALSWTLDEFEPLYASEPIIRKPDFKGFDFFSKCSDTDFEKSRIPPEESVEKVKAEKSVEKVKDQKKRGRKRLYKSISEDKIIKVDLTEDVESRTLSPLKKKARFDETSQNKNIIQANTANKKNMTKTSKVVSPSKAQNSLNSELRIVLNPVNCATKKVDTKRASPIKFQSEVTEFKVGDLAWAKLGGHPYWPCMIIEDPQTKKHKKTFVHRCHTLYHVRFFGDKGRRSWVSATNIFLYNGPKDLAAKAAFYRNEGRVKWSYINESFIVKPSKVPIWQIGVDEAESLVSKSLKDRLGYDFDSVKAKLKEVRTSGKFQVKIERRESIELIKPDIKIKVEVQDEEDTTTRRVTRASSVLAYESSDDSCDLSVSVKSELNDSYTSSTDSSWCKKDKHRKFQKEENFTQENLEARKKLRNSQIKPEVEKVQLEIKPEIHVVKKKRSSEAEGRRLSKRHLQGESSNSDSDYSKFCDNSSVPTSLESQAALFRRNNIFRGVTKDKVCQICEKGGEVFKCRGPCNGVFHSRCAIREIKKKEIEPDTGKKEDQVEIVTVNSKKPIPNITVSPTMKGMSLAEKIDYRMKEIMKNEDKNAIYPESTDSSTEEIESPKKPKTKSKLIVTKSPTKKEVPIIKHVTADDVSYVCVTDDQPIEDPSVFKCGWCNVNEAPPCLICQNEKSKNGSTFRQKCSLHQCGKYYHPECLKAWPQTQWSLLNNGKEKDTFVCPRHVCHTCVSDDPRAAISRCSSDKVVKCLKCPATYHTSSHCVPAGTEILTFTQIVCPRHDYGKKKGVQTINTNWCFLCAKGGKLICCETCPTSVHVECLPGDFNEADTFYCEDCQSGRLPLYDEIVWVKLGSFRWWPALILFPNEVPDNLNSISHNRGEFVVKFFGTYDHYWVGRGRTFLFQEGDKGQSGNMKKRVDNSFEKAIKEAAAAHLLKKQFKTNQANEKSIGLKPPPYIKIRVNKPVGNVRVFDGNTSNTTSCDCDPNDPHPCGPDSDCLNRLLLTECNPEVCPAGNRCNNQCFEKREYPPLVPHRTFGRGWGLKTLAPIRKGQFVIEYVGEVIDEQEYQRRIKKMHEQQEENYYFLTIDKDRMLDAGPKGNVARFMNHSCQPNCETQKWTVNGDTRVGLFAKCDIPAESELTFNYNLECVGTEKKICRCDAPNCSGFIGVKVKSETGPKKVSKPRKKKSPPVQIVDNDDPCFVCGQVGNVGACNNKNCTKFYHLKCVGLEAWPEGGKWVCPWHSCDICTKRTIRCCYKCVNSFCPPHSHSNIRYDKVLSAFVCFQHDVKVEPQATEDKNVKVNGARSTSIKKEESSMVESHKGKKKKNIPKKKRDKNTADIETILVSTRFLRSGAKFGSVYQEL